MLGEQARIRNNYMVTEVCIDTGRGQKDDISGYLVHSATQRAWRYEGLVSLMRLFEKLFNSENFPQATHKIRDMGIAGDRVPVSLEDMAMDANEIINSKPTFVVNVQYRQNASWQGTIKWLEGDKEATFRSALELIKLMDSVVGEDELADWK